MGKPLIFDSTPLIYLSKSSLSKFLRELKEEKYTPRSVFNEVVIDGKKRRASEASLLESIFKEEIISIRSLRDRQYLKFVKEMATESERQPLHETDAEVLCLSRELNGIAVVDDKVARAVARLLEIEVHGTIYVLGRLYSTGRITRETLLSKVREMRVAGWHVSGEDYYKITEYLNGL
jgi:predicted nucleic acid-binding protein